MIERHLGAILRKFGEFLVVREMNSKRRQFARGVHRDGGLHREDGIAFLEVALIFALFLGIIATGYLAFAPTLDDKLKAIDLEQAMQGDIAVAPDTCLFREASAGTSHDLLPAADVRERISEVANRISFNARMGMCGLLVEITNTAGICFAPDGVTPVVPLNRGAIQASVISVDRNLSSVSGSNVFPCDQSFVDDFLDNTGGCFSRFRQIVPVDCEAGDRRAFAIVMLPRDRDEFGSCGVMSPHSCQPTPETFVTGLDPRYGG